MTHDATTGANYTFDQENRITGAGGYTYTYDADGNRVEKSNGSTGTLYWYMSPGIVAESDLTGALKSEYVFFDGARVARKDFSGTTTSIFYYFADHLKTASVITDSAGTIKEDEDYYPWGGELQFVNNDSNHYKFTGKERDSETGLDYFGARHYSNWLGRWMSPDWSSAPVPVPYADLMDPQSLNLYSYVRNIPTSQADGDGHCPPCPVFEETGVDVGEQATYEAAMSQAGTQTAVASETATTTSAAGTAAEEGASQGGSRVLGLLGRTAGIAGIILGNPVELNHGEQEWIDKQRAMKFVGPVDIVAKRKSSKTIRREWEKAKGKKWPKDKSGNNYDADHKKALADGGSNNAARNITPRKRKDHIKRHKRNGDFKRWAKRAHQ